MNIKNGTCAIVVMAILAAGPFFCAATPQVSAPQPQRKERAMGLLKHAIEIAHSEPDPVGKAMALMVIAGPLANIGETERAADLLAEADRLMQPVEELGDGLSKNLVLFPLAATYAAAGRIERAEAILDGVINEFEEMAASPESESRGRAADHRAAWLVEFAPLYVSFGKRQKVTELLAVNHERLKTINHGFYRDRGVSRTAMAYAALGERERAVEMAKTVEPGRSADEAWSMIAVAYAQAGDLDKAYELVQSRGSGFEASYFLWIAERFLDHGRKDKGVAIIQRLASRDETKETQRRAPYGEIAIGWALVGEFEKALRTSKRVASHAEQMRTLTGLAKIFFKAGRVKEANRLSLKASELTGFSKGSYYEGLDLKEVADTYAAIEQKQEAAKLLSFALDVVAKSHEGVEDMILADIAVSYASLGLDGDAICAAQAITNKGDQARTLAAIAGIQLGIKWNYKPLQPFGPFKLPY